MKRDSIDFHAVEEAHFAIHARLLNWAKWCNGTGSSSASPMFRLYRASARARDHYMTDSCTVVDQRDALRVAKAVVALPPENRSAINWSYVRPVNPKRACEAIGTSLEGLMLLVRDGRQILLTREV